MESDKSGEILRGDEASQRLNCSKVQVDARGARPRTTHRSDLRTGHTKSGSLTRDARNLDPWSSRPMTVKEAARFLGVSTQTVYLWVERKQIPHFRVMGRNIRFLKSDLKPFRAQFKHEVENGKTA
jgi:excisionase family DNA binding protein